MRWKVVGDAPNQASINNLTHSLAMDLGPRGITVNAVAPGWTRTDMNAAVRENADMVAAVETDTALGRFGEASEIAAVVAFLASKRVVGDRTGHRGVQAATTAGRHRRDRVFADREGPPTGEIAAHFAEVYGASVSKDTISPITDKVLGDMTEVSCPLDPMITRTWTRIRQAGTWTIDRRRRPPRTSGAQ